jgi:hypothetical protein
MRSPSGPGAFGAGATSPGWRGRHNETKAIDRPPGSWGRCNAKPIDRPPRLAGEAQRNNCRADWLRREA